MEGRLIFMSKMDQVEQLWDRYEKYKETAEQHEFIKLIFLDTNLIPYYNDLHTNYTEEHADKFIRVMSQVLGSLGIDNK